MCRLNKQVTLRQFRLVALGTGPGVEGGGWWVEKRLNRMGILETKI